METSALHSPIDPDSYIPTGSLIVKTCTIADWVTINQDNIHLLGFKNPLTPLLKADWARAQIRSHQQNTEFSVIRVYVLPDDVGRGVLERSDRILLKRLQELLRSLDATSDAWEGKKQVDTRNAGYSDYSEDDDSLFYLFNTIPSPNPHALNVPCTNSQESIDSLLELDGLPSLRTRLHPYQKRAAATMIRREVHPLKSLDPRLSPVTGPLGHRFYYDSIAGRIYLNPRTYDEVAGGGTCRIYGPRQDLDMPSDCVGNQRALAVYPTRVLTWPMSCTLYHWIFDADGCFGYSSTSDPLENLLSGYI